MKTRQYGLALLVAVAGCALNLAAGCGSESDGTPTSDAGSDGANTTEGGSFIDAIVDGSRADAAARGQRGHPGRRRARRDA